MNLRPVSFPSRELFAAGQELFLISCRLYQRKHSSDDWKNNMAKTNNFYRWKIGILLAAGLFLVGCNPTNIQSDSPSPGVTLVPSGSTVSPSEVLATTPEVNGTDYDPALDSYVQQAKEDLATRLSISTGDIETIAAQTMVWPDASDGCPKPGVNYIQVQEEGVLVRLAYQGQIYEYHRGESRPLFLCEPNLK